MPELVASNGVRFTLSEDALVGRHDEGGTFKPDVDLGSLGRTVSRQHARIYLDGQLWHLKVHPLARNATVVAGQTLAPEQETILHDGDEIKLGTVSVVFRADRTPPPSDPNATIVRTGPALAELQTGELHFPLSVAEGRVLTLGRHSDDLKYRPDVDLRDAANGATISRRHGELFHRGDTWFMRVEADSTNDTYLNASRLKKGDEVALSDGDQVRMGSAVATFRQAKAFDYTDRLDLVLGPPTDLTIEAGSQGSTSLTLVNFTGRVDWFTLEVTGVPNEWWKIIVPDGTTDQVPQVRLDTAIAPRPTPSATARATVVLTAPRRPDARAGAYPLLAIATSLDERRFRRSAAGQLIVLPFTSLRLNVDAPQARGGRGTYHLGVHNDGNAPVSVSLLAETDPKCEARLEHPAVNLANGAETRVDLSLRVRHRPWLGPEVVHSARVTSTAEGQVAMQDVSLTTPPRVPIWLQNLFGRFGSGLKPIVLVLAVLAAVLVVGYLFLRPPDVKLTPEKPLVASGASTTLSWIVDRGSGEAVLEGPTGSQQVPVKSGQATITPDQTSVYKLTAKNWLGLSVTETTKVQVLRVLEFTVTAEALKKIGDPVTLQWSTENATSVTIEPPDEITAFPPSGKAVVHPKASTTYKLVASNEQYQAQTTAERRATFGAPKITQFQQDKQQVFPGDPVLLTWAADGFSQLTLKNDTQDLDLNVAGEDVTRRASIQVRPLKSGHYDMIAANADGTTELAQVSIDVLPVKVTRLQAPTKPISAGETATLTWQIEGANDRTRVILQPDGTDLSGRPSIEVRPASTTEYKLVVTAADGQVITSPPATVSVLPAIQEFKVAPASITEGEPVVLTWTVVDAQSVTVTRDDGIRVAQGGASDEARDRPPASVTSYTLKARNATGESIDSPASTIKVKVVAPTPVPTLPPPPTPAPAPTAPAPAG